jgi:hypothetical protein
LDAIFLDAIFLDAIFLSLSVSHTVSFYEIYLPMMERETGMRVLNFGGNFYETSRGNLGRFG